MKLVLDVLLRALHQELQSTKREATLAGCEGCHVSFFIIFLRTVKNNVTCRLTGKKTFSTQQGEIVKRQTKRNVRVVCHTTRGRIAVQLAASVTRAGVSPDLARRGGAPHGSVHLKARRQAFLSAFSNSEAQWLRNPAKAVEPNIRGTKQTELVAITWLGNFSRDVSVTSRSYIGPGHEGHNLACI